MVWRSVSSLQDEEKGKDGVEDPDDAKAIIAKAGCVSVCLSVCLHACIRTYICVYVCTYVCMTYVFVCLCVV